MKRRDNKLETESDKHLPHVRELEASEASIFPSLKQEEASQLLAFFELLRRWEEG